MKKAKLFLLVFIIPVVLASCTTDSKEIDDQVYALVIGCDKANENKIRLTIQFPIYKGSGSGSQQGGGGSGGQDDEENGVIGNTVVETVEAPSVLDAINLMNTATSRKISFVHTKAIILSEDIAREGVMRYLQPIARFRETRRIMQVMVCRGTAQEFIRENKTQVGESVAKAMEQAIDQSDNTGFFPRSPYHEFYSKVISPYVQPYSIYAGINDYTHLKPLAKDASSPLKVKNESLPGELPRKGDRRIELLGAAVFDGDKMVGRLTAYETRYLMILNNTFKNGILVIEDRNADDLVIPLDIRLGRKTIVKAHFRGNTPVIDIKINIEADLGAIQSQYPYEQSENIDKLNDQIEDTIKKGVEDTIKKAQTEWNSDIFGFGKKVARNFTTITNFLNYNWLNHFKNAEINVEVTSNVRRTGLMMESSKVYYND